MKKLMLLLLLFAMLTMTACGNTADKISSELAKGNYEKAGELYSEKVRGNIKIENEVKAKLSAIISETLVKYNEGKLKYEDAIALLDASIKSGIVESWEIENTYASISNLNFSKEQYNKGKENIASHNYWEAYTNFSNVISTDANYQDAQKQMSEAESASLREIAEHLNELVKQKAFDEGYSYIQEQEYRWPNNSALVTEEENFLKRWAESNIAEAEKLAESNQFADAIGQLAMPNGYATPEMYAEIDRINASWKAYSMSLAETAFGGADKNAQGAINALLSTGIDTSLVDNEIAYYEKYLPVNLCALEPTKKAEYIRAGLSNRDDCKDVNGNTYEGKTCIAPCGGGLRSEVAESDEDATITYYLNAEFEKLSGMLYRPYSTLKADAVIWEYVPTVKIYGDGALLYEGPRIDGSTYETVRFELNVSGIRELKIIMRGVWGENNGFGWFTRYPKVVMTDVWIRR